MPDSFIISLRRRVARKILGDIPLVPAAPELDDLTPEQLLEMQQLFPMPKFFIFGYPRSGTTLLMRLVSLHPQVHCSREGHFFTRSDKDATRLFSSPEIRVWLSRKSNRWTSGQHLETPIVRLVADYLMEREARREGKTLVGDKTPNSNGGQAVQRLHAVYPDARLIYIVRDGRDACLSHRFQHFIDHPEFLDQEDLRIRKDFAADSAPFFARQRSVFTEKAIRSAARAWAQSVYDTVRLGNALFPGSFASLRYEDLLARPVDESCRLWQFLGVDPGFPNMPSLVEDKMQYNPGVEAHQAKENAIARNLPRGKQGAWKQLFTDRDASIFNEEARHTLADWGYE